MLSGLAQRHLGDAAELLRDDLGRPALRLGDGRILHASITHSADRIAVALALEGRVGIDVERIEPGRNWRGIARAAFGPGEAARAIADGPATFHRIWCLREALAKATGAGLALVADRLDRFHQDLPDAGGVLTLPEGVWRFRLEEQAGCVLALAWDASGEAAALVS